MTNLFIIGNGFDLDHGLKTSYNHFRQYLLSKYPGINMDMLTIPTEIPLPDGGVEYDDVEVLSMLFYLINNAEQNDEKWSNIERSLGYLDFSEAFNSYDDILNNEDDIAWWAIYNNEDIASQLVIPTSKIQRFFSEWVNTINLSPAKPKKDFIKLVNEGDKFLTFNYTETLELVYGINPDDVCHIHGMQYEEIFFGHGNSTTDYYDKYMANFTGSQGDVLKIFEQLKKDTARALEKKLAFFDQLENERIRSIYSYGFSFNKVDFIYFEEICKRIKTENIIWYFNDFDISNIGHYIQYLKNCGFKGNFNTFHIEE